MSTFKTIKKTSTSFFKEKGSKFYVYAFPIHTKEDVKECLEKIQEEHPKARHICSAFLIGIGDQEYYIANDDGEPANSAGAPILGQIRSAGITNTYIAVVRYFGGTKLGVGGLIQAYKLGAALALKENEIIEVEPQASLSFKIGFDLMGKILPIIDKNILDAKIENHTDGVQIGLTFNEKDESIIRGLFERWVTI
ncbi:YigZ family protein [Vicingaceae bacterium]|nr:YigZ family protein [Vicingaceae bacterium]MDB4060768.1 YigZ family protein [Vicingaceae bacterium]